MARGKLTVAFSPVWLRPPSVLPQTGLDLRREAQGLKRPLIRENLNVIQTSVPGG